MDTQPKPRGFAAMDPERRRQIASKGGSSRDPSTRSFSKDRDLAAEAGRKGGKANKAPRTFAADPEAASIAGKKGAAARYGDHEG